jgi:hypothetical protein
MGNKTFIDYGNRGIPPDGYKWIRCHMVYNVKHDGRHKSRLVAVVHLTVPSPESNYSGVVPLRVKTDKAREKSMMKID